MTGPVEKRAPSVVPLPCAACAPNVAVDRPPAPNEWSRRASLLSAAALVLLPKCPLCVLGWLGAIGLGGMASHAGAIPLVFLGLFGASQAVFLISARRTGDARAFVAAAIGVSWLVACYAFGAGPGLRWVGVGLLVLASVFNALAIARSRTAQGRARASF